MHVCDFLYGALPEPDKGAKHDYPTDLKWLDLVFVKIILSVSQTWSYAKKALNIVWEHEICKVLIGLQYCPSLTLSLFLLTKRLALPLEICNSSYTKV